VHKSRNVVNFMPKSVHSRVKAVIKVISCAESKKVIIKAIEAFAKEFGVKWPKAIEKITSDKEALLTFYHYPAEPWRHLRTTTP